MTNTTGELRDDFNTLMTSLLKTHEDWAAVNRHHRTEMSPVQWLKEFCYFRMASGRSIGLTTWVTQTATPPDLIIVPSRPVADQYRFSTSRLLVVVPGDIRQSAIFSLIRGRPGPRRVFIDRSGNGYSHHDLIEILSTLAWIQDDLTVVDLG